MVKNGSTRCGPRERDEIGAPRRHDGVDLVRGGDGADAHGGEAALVADLVGERCLVHAAVDRLGVRARSGRSTRRSGRTRPRRTAAPPPPHRRRSARRRPNRSPRCAPTSASRPATRRASARNTSSGKRRRLSSEPPYSSVRVLVSGEMKLASRYPCAQCSSTMSKPARSRALRRGHEVGDDAVHVGACHLARHLAVRVVGQGRGRHDRPGAGVQRLVDPFPHQLGRALTAGMTELHADLGGRVGVDEIDDAFPRGLVLVAYTARCSRARCAPPPTRRSSR